MDALVVRVPEGQSPKQCKEKIPIPSPAPNQALVKLSHAAQNPTDGVSDPGSTSEKSIPAHFSQCNPLMETLLATEPSLDAILSERSLS
jgi:hypothetical protein